MAETETQRILREAKERTAAATAPKKNGDYPWPIQLLVMAVFLVVLYYGLVGIGWVLIKTGFVHPGVNTCPSYVTQGSSNPAQDCYDYDHPNN